MNADAILKQSKNAYRQWKELWRKHAKMHGKFTQKSLEDYVNSGVGKALLLVANGYSFEENIETIKKYRDQVEIMACDKTLGHLIDNGIKPDFCLVCDAMVDYEKYMKPWEDQLDETVLFMNVCANYKWSHNGNWKDSYFFVNKDIIKSELEFGELSGCPNIIPAGTNVSNAMVVFATQSDNLGRRNFFGYDKILLIGFDYCWKFDGKYYAFDEDGYGKKYYMKHRYLKTRGGEDAYTSNNLLFSAQWLESYIANFKLPVVNCSKSTILGITKTCDLAEQMQYNYKREDGVLVRRTLAQIRKLKKELMDKQLMVKEIDKDHWFKFIATTH